MSQFFVSGSGGGGGGGGFTWVDASGVFLASVGDGYFITGASTATLPVAPSQGQAVAFILKTSSTLTIQASPGQTIVLGNTSSSVAGTCSSTLSGDAIVLIYRVSGNTWNALDSIGLWGLV